MPNTTKYPGISTFILSTSEGWKAESSIEPPGGQEYRITELVIQHSNNYIIAPTTSDKVFWD